MIEKIVRALIVGIVLACGTLIGFGWKAYAEMNSMGKAIKEEIKKEMMEVRRLDMEHIQGRFNTLEVLIAGKVISPQKQFTEDETK